MSEIEYRTTNPVSFGDLFLDLWNAKFYLLIFCLLSLGLTYIFLKETAPEYKASMIVAPADGYALGDYASSVNTERMASLPFWRPSDPEGISTDYYRFIHTLNGHSVAEILSKDISVLDGINAARPSDKMLTTVEELADYLSRNVKVSQLGTTPLRQIEYRHPKQSFAPALLRKINLVSDQLIRRDRRRQSQNRIEYLQSTLDKTKHPDHRKVIATLLTQQEHVQMLANLDEAYAAIVVEPAATGPKPDWPNPYYFYSAAVFIGLFLGYLSWSFVQSVRRPV